ncbi:response regulator [Myxococcaceae bacterium JPH2]|nr:response regulator [Myxococcaceae bacterium JPH2]
MARRCATEASLDLLRYEPASCPLPNSGRSGTRSWGRGSGCVLDELRASETAGRVTVLVVEDEQGILEAVADLLRDEGFRVLCAAHGREALAHLERDTPDLVLTDWMMPVLDGPALVEAIRANPRLRDLALLGMSAVDVSLLRRKFPELEFLQKPFDIQTLLEKVHQALAAARRG